MSSDDLPKVYTLTGHGETALDSRIAEMLSQDNFESDSPVSYTHLEYLDFVARAKGVPAKERATQLEAVIEKTHIQEVRKDVYKRQVVSTVALMSPVAPALSALACTLPICRISPSRGVTWSSTISHRSMQLLRRRTV